MFVSRQGKATMRPRARRMVGFAAAALAMGVGSLVRADTTWINWLGDGVWGSAGNWTDGVPDSLDVATLSSSPVGPIGTITLSGSGNEAKELVFDAGGYTLSGGELRLDNGRITSHDGNSTIGTSLTGPRRADQARRRGDQPPGQQHL